MEERNPTYRASFTIRQARAGDAPKLISGINDICSEGGAFYTTSFVHTPEWDRVLYYPETAAGYTLAVAEWNGQIVGAGRLFRGGEITLMQHTAELGLFVLAPFRRQGIGSKILDWLILWAISERVEKITLVTFATNEPAIRLFEKQGFVYSGRMIRQIKTAGGYIDLLGMEKFL
jgi:L-amino acid N-acyltransferase YncA